MIDLQKDRYGPAAGVPWYQRPLAAFSAKATGPDPTTARMVQASLLLVDFEKAELLPGSYARLIQTDESMPVDLEVINGFTSERVAAEGDSPVMALSALYNILIQVEALDVPLVMFNAPFDWVLLKSEWRRANFHNEPEWKNKVPEPRILDVLTLDRHFDPYRPGGRKLSQLARHYRVRRLDPRDLESDAMAALGIIVAMLERHPELRLTGPEDLHYLQEQVHRLWVEDMNAEFERQGSSKRIVGSWPG